MRHTWAHVVDAARAELGAHALRSRKPKVGDSETETAVKAKDVLGLQVSMINIEGVAVFNRVEQLKKDLLDEGVIAEIAPLVKNLGEKVAVGAVVHDDKRVLVVLDYPVKSNNIGVTRCELVEGDLANVELALAGGVALGRVR